MGSSWVVCIHKLGSLDRFSTHRFWFAPWTAQWQFTYDVWELCKYLYWLWNYTLGAYDVYVVGIDYMMFAGICGIPMISINAHACIPMQTYTAVCVSVSVCGVDLIQYMWFFVEFEDYSLPQTPCMETARVSVCRNFVENAVGLDGGGWSKPPKWLHATSTSVTAMTAGVYSWVQVLPWTTFPEAQRQSYRLGEHWSSHGCVLIQGRSPSQFSNVSFLCDLEVRAQIMCAQTHMHRQIDS